jgi:transposase-like protein
MSRTSKRFTPAQKAEIVGRHLSGKEPVSDLADKFGAQPSQIHNWPGRPRDYSLGLPQIRICAA